MENTFIFFRPGANEASPEILLFREPLGIITAVTPGEIDSCLSRLDKAIGDGYYAAGFLSYDLGYRFLEIPYDSYTGFPLICFGIFQSMDKITLPEAEKALKGNDFSLTDGYYTVPRDEYTRDIRIIKDHLENGNTYQVNYTFKYKFMFSGSPDSFFISLLNRQPVPYAAMLETGNWAVLSMSPELFFSRSGQRITVKPMKGTINRGFVPRMDELNSQLLERSEKNRAENIMIVDLLRNDLGKISLTGSVLPEKLFSVEKYNTLFQMTSTVNSTLKSGISWESIFRNIFPSGSVTGAPKKRTMEIIHETEKEARNIYTGSAGYITPGGDALFNVAIRTVLIDKNTGRSELGIGSGIVYDSDPDKEYDECLLKGSFMTGLDIKQEFELIETMLFEEGGVFLLDLHMKRLAKSAAVFSFKCNVDDIVALLQKETSMLDRDKKYRIRLLLGNDGVSSVTVSPLTGETVISRVKISVSGIRTDKNDFFLRHKTTRRTLYDTELETCRKNGYFDVLFFNSEGELTEGAISNVMLRKGHKYFTPPLECGLLGGVCREYLMGKDDMDIQEKVLYPRDLRSADGIFLMNSVRKMIPAELDNSLIPRGKACP